MKTFLVSASIVSTSIAAALGAFALAGQPALAGPDHNPAPESGAPAPTHFQTPHPGGGMGPGMRGPGMRGPDMMGAHLGHGMMMATGKDGTGQAAAPCPAGKDTGATDVK